MSPSSGPGVQRHSTEHGKRSKLREAKVIWKVTERACTRAEAVAVSFREWVVIPYYSSQTNKCRKR